MDSSVRGRLLRLLERVRKFREKKVEVEPEAEEEKKPGEHRPLSLSQSPLFTATSILYVSETETVVTATVVGLGLLVDFFIQNKCHEIFSWTAICPYFGCSLANQVL